MKRILFPLIFLLCSPAALQAQSVKDNEEGSFLLCTSGSGPEVESQACIDWIVASMKRTTYSDRIHSVEVMLSDSDMLKYRIQADQQLQNDVEPIMAVRLNFDILKKLTSPKDRLTRLERIVYWSEKLAPNQRQTVIRDIILLNDFPSFVQTKTGKEFVEQCRDESPMLLPDISEDTTSFLRNLESQAPSLMTPQAGLVLFIQELRAEQYVSAQQHLSELEKQIDDWDKLPENLRNTAFSTISHNALKFMGFAEFKNIHCFPELAGKSDRHAALLDRLISNPAYRNPAIVLSHIIAAKLGQCQYEGATESLFKSFDAHYRDADLASIVEQLIAYAEKVRQERLTASIMQSLSTLSQPALAALKKHAPRLIKLSLEACNNALDRKDAERARAISSSMLKFAQDASRPEVLIALGRVQALLKNNAQARQYWSQVIEESKNSPWTEQAYYLSILSFHTDGKTSDASALKKQFSEANPASQYLRMLP